MDINKTKKTIAWNANASSCNKLSSVVSGVSAIQRSYLGNVSLSGLHRLQFYGYICIVQIYHRDSWDKNFEIYRKTGV